MRITTFQFCHLDWAGSAALESAKNIRNELVRSLEIGYLVPYLPENLIPEVLEIARNIRNGFEKEKEIVLSSLVPYLPENLIPEALEIAKNIGDESLRAEALSSLAPYLPENLIPEVLEIARNIGDESLRAEGLNGLVTNVHKMFDSFPYDFWCELIHSLARLKRKKLLLTIGENSRVIRELGGSETFREIADAVNDVGRWFP